MKSRLKMEIIKLSTDHLYRRISEITEKTYGGYITGKVVIDPNLLREGVFLNISLVSDEKALVDYRIHPNLLYMTRFESNIREKALESKSPMGQLELYIEKDQVYWCKRYENHELRWQKICTLKEEENKSGIINVLDLKNLYLTIIIPLQRPNTKGIKISEAINMKKQLTSLEFLEDYHCEEIVKNTEQYYKGNGKSELHRTCLLVSLSKKNSKNYKDQKPTLQLISRPIMNTRSQTLGLLNLIPDKCSPQITCTYVSRRIHLQSQYKLPQSDKEVYPRFVTVFPGKGTYSLDDRIVQPTEVQIFAQQMVIFQTPMQNDNSIQGVYNDGLKIYLEIYRPGDQSSSSVKTEFQFTTHHDLQKNINMSEKVNLCTKCIQHPDKLRHTDKSQEVKPGKRKRTGTCQATSSTDSSIFTQPISKPFCDEIVSSGFQSTPANTWSPTGYQTGNPSTGDTLITDMPTEETFDITDKSTVEEIVAIFEGTCQATSSTNNSIDTVNCVKQFPINTYQQCHPHQCTTYWQCLSQTINKGEHANFLTNAMEDEKLET